MLDLVYENQTDSEWPEDFFKNILEAAIKETSLDAKKIETGLYLIQPERSRELNAKHRGKDKPTDVLSFPLEEKPVDGILPLGDIFICFEVAKSQAEEFKIPLKEELARLAVHGFLHLIGYDHERSPGEEEKMIALQEKILKNLNF